MRRVFALVLAVAIVLSVFPVITLDVNAIEPGIGDKVLDGGKRDFLWPVPGWYGLSGCFEDSRNHDAIDIPATEGTKVVASYGGKVLEAFNSGSGYGKCVLIEHEYTLLTGERIKLYSKYNHLYSYAVSAGDYVNAGDKVGEVGHSGGNYGNHLDFQIMTSPDWRNYNYHNISVDPFVNELLEMPESLYPASTKDCCGVGPEACCCYEYIQYVKKLYETPIVSCIKDTYPCHVTLTTPEASKLWNMPCSDATSDEAKEVGKTKVGDTLTATALYLNTQDKYWYEVTYNGSTCYIYGGNTEVEEGKYTDLEIKDVVAPSHVEKGKVFVIGGTISTKHLELEKVYVEIKKDSKRVLYGEEVVNGTSYSLKGSAIDNALTFNTLDDGTYSYTVYADVKTYYTEDGKSLDSMGLCKTLHSNEFTVGNAHICDMKNYVYIWKSHPHYKCYACSVCGKVTENRNEPTTLNTCAECRPGKPTLNVTTEGACGENGQVTFGWENVSNTTHYNLWIHRKNDSGEWEVVERFFDLTEGFSLALTEGEYRAQLLAYNSEMWEPDGSDWVHTNADDVFFFIGHNVEEWTNTWVDCTSNGAATGVCTNCSNTIIMEIAPRGHFLNAEEIPATCIQYAGIRYTCESCGYSYEEYASGEDSGWTPVYPEGIAENLIKSKVQYRYSDYETKSTNEVASDDWTLVETSWQQKGIEDIRYVKNWPSGFSTSHSLYSEYNHTPVSESESDTEKTTVNSDEVTGYLYFHWCRGTYANGPINRGSKDTKQGEFTAFHAFYSTTAPSSLQAAPDHDGSYKYENGSCCKDTYWYYTVPVYTQNYTEYVKLYIYERWTAWSEWSDEVYTESDTRKVETRTVYSYATGGLGAHDYHDGYCTVCGDEDPNYVFAHATVQVGSVNGAPGETVMVPVTISDNPGFAGFTFVVDFDERALILNNISAGAVLDASESGAFTKNVGGKTVTWVDYLNTTENGVLLELTFTIAESATESSYSVRIGLKNNDPTNFVDENSRAGHIVFEDGVIEVTAHTHDYNMVVTEPTCTEGGYTTYTCSCGDSYVDSHVAALGHDMSNWKVVKAASCTAKGEEQRNCSRCDHVETRIIEATGHSYKAVVTAPTCTEQGYTTHTCANCGDIYVDGPVAALGHDMSNWEVVKAATCTAKGEEKRNCTRCDHSETRSIDKTDHIWDSGQVTKEPTEDVEGEKTYTCTACGETKTEAIPKIDHVHNYIPAITDPTCEKAGFTTYTCTCGKSYVDNYTSALGHDLGAWYVEKEPGCTENGEERHICSRCDYYEVRVIEATGHNHAAVITEPTCTENGYTTYTCACGDSYIADETDPLGHEFVDGTCTRCGEADPDYEAPTGPVENPFTDVKETDYFFEPVLWAVENSITSGTSATTFAPNATCTRAQVVTFLWRTMGQPEPQSTVNPFSDVTEWDYFYKAVLWAVENGITAGTGNGQFSPNRPCTRDQVVTFLWRTLGKPVPQKTDNPFADVAEGVYYYEPVLWAVENGITAGTSATTFAPSNPCTRGQVVTFLYRAMKNR